MKSKNIHLLFVKSKNIHQSLLSKHIYQLFVKLVKFGHIGNQLVTSIESRDMSAFIYIYVGSKDDFEMATVAGHQCHLLEVFTEGL